MKESLKNIVLYFDFIFYRKWVTSIYNAENLQSRSNLHLDSNRDIKYNVNQSNKVGFRRVVYSTKPYSIVICADRLNVLILININVRYRFYLLEGISLPHCNKRMISFFLTTKCNLCCRYCYNAKERNEIEEQTIPLEVAFAGIDWYFANNDSRHIRFYGPGEPTQEFEKMANITSYAKSHPNRGNEVTVEIQTNGVFTPSIRDWIYSFER